MQALAGLARGHGHLRQATGHLRRVLETLGLERRQRDVRELSLDEINAEYAQRNAEVRP